MGSERLREQLSAIRSSIARFEKEINLGVERSKRENDDKFEKLRRKIGELTTRVEEERKTCEEDAENLKQSVENSTEETAQNLSSLYKEKMGVITVHVDHCATRCEDLCRQVGTLKARRDGSRLRDLFQGLELELEGLKTSLIGFSEEAAAEENAMLEKMRSLEVDIERELAEWDLAVAGAIQELRRTFARTGSILPGQSQNQHFPRTGEVSEPRTEELGTEEPGTEEPGTEEPKSESPPALARRAAIYGQRGSASNSSDTDLDEKSGADRIRGSEDPTAFNFINENLGHLQEDVTQLRLEREHADEEIISAVQRYTQTLQKSLEASSLLKNLAQEIAGSATEPRPEGGREGEGEEYDGARSGFAEGPEFVDETGESLIDQRNGSPSRFV